MTPKQKLRSLEKRMKLLQEKNPYMDMEDVSRKFFDIQRYFNLKQEHFLLKFEIEHCQTCGKKLKD